MYINLQCEGKTDLRYVSGKCTLEKRVIHEGLAGWFKKLSDDFSIA
jgi:hypothetical protein